jgi:hypothetical protein
MLVIYTHAIDSDNESRFNYYAIAQTDRNKGILFRLIPVMLMSHCGRLPFSR